MQRIKHHAPRFRGRRLLLVPVVFISVCLLEAAVESTSLRVREVIVTDPDIPASFRGLRMAFLTDLHHGPYIARERIAALVRQTNALAPDLVLLGGDYSHRGPQYIGPCFDELGKLKATYGVFGVLGNHDRWESAARTLAAMRKNGIDSLDNDGRWLWKGRERIRIGGVGDLWTDHQDLSATTREAKESDFVVLVSHNPDYAEELPDGKVDLMLCGHTHGGQVTLFGFYAPILPTATGQKYRSGVVDTPLCKVIISNGTGMITPPVRFGAPAEIVLVILN